MNLQFDGKVAIVTGGATGIGAAAAEKLCQLGASVAILDRNAEAAEARVRTLSEAGHTATFHPCDVAVEDDVKRAVDAVVRQHGRLDVLVSNAGIQTYGNVVSTTDELWDRTLDVHVKGCFYATKFAIPAMLASGGGAIVIIASALSFTAVQNSAAYVAAKARAAGYHPFDRSRFCPAKYSRQLHLSRGYRHAHAALERGPVRLAGGVARISGAKPRHGQDWTAGRSRECGCISGQRLGIVHHRSQPHGGWRAAGSHRRHGFSGIWNRQGRSMMSTGALAGKIAVITGTGAGIGRASALLFAEEGASVAAIDLDEARNAELVQEIQSKGGSAEAFTADVASTRDVEDVARQIQQRWKRVDILFNNAGIVTGGKVHTLEEEEWDRAFAINVKSMFLLSRAIIPMFLEQGGGVILNMSSTTAIRVAPDRALYGATKGAVFALTKSMAVDYAADNIRVNCLCPGTVDTPSLNARLAAKGNAEEARKQFIARQPLRRIGKAEEIAKAALYLVSDDAAFVTGTAFQIDGGMSL